MRDPTAIFSATATVSLFRFMLTRPLCVLYGGRMTNGFAFHESQPVIDEDEDGLPIVAVYPAGAAYPVAGSGGGWVSVLLPSDGGDIESSFPESVGTLTDAPAPAPATLVPYRDAAKRYPDLISAEELESYEAAAKSIAEWR